MASPKKRRLIKLKRLEKAGLASPVVEEEPEEVMGLRELKEEVIPIPIYDIRMRKKELMELAESLGAEVDYIMTKAEIIERLDALD